MLTSTILFHTIITRKTTKQSRREASSYIHSFWSSALVSVLSKWIKDGMQVPAEKIASLGLPLMIQGKSKEKRK